MGSCNVPWTIPQPPSPKCSPSLAIRQSGSIIPTHETHDRLAPSRDIYICFFSSVFPLHLARLIEIINILVCINKTHANLLVPLKYQPICHIFIPHMEWQGEFQNVKFTDMERVRVDTTENVRFILVETRHRQHRSRHRGLWFRNIIDSGLLSRMDRGVHLRASVWSPDSFMTCTSLSLQSFSFNCAGFCKSFLRSEVRRVPSIPLSLLLIRASRWFDRCPPQPELSSKNGLTLETWIFIFSDNCTMSGHIRPGLMRNRLRAGTDAEWGEMERGLESTQGQRWKRNENENFPNIFHNSLNSSCREVSDKMMLWWYTTRSGPPIKVTPCRWQNRNFLIFTRIRTHANPCIDSYHDIFNLSGYPQPTAAQDTWDYHKISP